MSHTNKYNTTYSAADIEKYLKGELTPREMHDLENAALEDPFLADALDGMSGLLSSAPADTSLGRDLDELHTRLNARVAAGRDRNNIRRPAPRWSIAAILILLPGIGCLTYYAFFTGGRPKIVAPSSFSVTSSSPVAAPPSGTVAASPPPAESTAFPKQATPPASPALTEPPALARSTGPTLAKQRTEEEKTREEEAREDKAPEDKAMTPMTKAIPDIMRNVTPPNTMSNSPSRADAAADTVARTSAALVFSGRVLDDHDNPVPGASLTLGYRNTGTVTDRQGQFKLYLSAQDSARDLTVAMTGFGQKSLPLNTLTTNDMADHVIHLQPNEASLDEVVVTGFGVKRKETLAAAPSDSKEELDSLWHKARPVIGKYAYLHYLDTAQKGLALDSSITGTEAVSFVVGKKGTLTSFKIEQSLSPAHDEAIIRLVKEGPAWQLLKQKKVRALVSLHF